jgi:DEAD/DEAH box helicase domain-containing protein
MLTLHQAYEVQASIFEYLKATYGFRERAVAQAFEQFINDEQEGMFKGPYVSLKLPFETSGQAADLPLEIRPNFPPFDHQAQAFRKLSTREEQVPQPTILTTGTGSGKTEAFLYPLLDYCYRQRDRQGIKCIILYPMNALATDQAARLAKTIWQDKRLRGQVTAGLFIGVGKDGKKYPKDMAEGHIIENRESILDSPPDILLTNFKMLDYALMRENYQRLWQHNHEDSSLLRFLVLDELHTYDGAQGTDVANLIRRLKLKLGVEAGQLCPIGTSATMGSGVEAPALLAQYASRVFGEHITTAAIISEKRMELDAFFGQSKEELHNRLPSTYKLKDTLLQTGEAYENYLARQLDVWQLDPSMDEVQLGKELKKLRLVWDIVELCHQGLFTVKELIAQLSRVNLEFRKLPEWEVERQFSPREAILRSIFSLIARAKTMPSAEGSTTPLPLLYLQVQLWISELSGIMRVFAPEPRFTWRDKSAQKPQKAFPPYFCRECGASGWIAVKHDNRNHLENDPGDTYSKYFANHKNIFFLNTDIAAHQHVPEYSPSEVLHSYVHEENLGLYDNQGPGRLGVYAYRVVQNNHSVHLCPECNSRNTLAIIGGRISTLSSVAVSQLLASDLDAQAEKDRKLLIFANGVQDAAHLAAFVGARNYRFSFRTALQKVINAQAEAISLDALQEKFITYWKTAAGDGRGKGIEAYLHQFFPSDHAGDIQLSSYQQANGSYKSSFVAEFDARVRWEIASEFGFNAYIGRTLEKTRSSGVRFQQALIERVFPALEPWLQTNNMQMIRSADLERFLNGFLHRVRIRGGIDHVYLEKYRSQSLKLWELNWNRDKRHYLNRRFGPQSRFPRLLATVPESRGIVDSTFTRQDNWFHQYYRKCFALAPAYADAINEFYAQVLNVLTSAEVGILNQAQAGGLDNYCLSPGSIELSKQCGVVQCNTCGHNLTLEQAAVPIMEGASCIQYRCIGLYQALDFKEQENYYRQVYNRRRAPRIYAADHTGLLERKNRERVEFDFKNRPRVDSLNTLVATSTLEMGIDIGDLNITINSDVPPLPANFLQRVGRAGRKSGSALILNFAAAGEPHDLYYFEAPREMMEGNISTPGCYLDAREILKRHYFAYCMDSWASDPSTETNIPTMVRQFKLSSLNLEDPGFFLNRLERYIRQQEQALFVRFKTAYTGQVEAAVFQELEQTFRNGQFYTFPKKAFERMQAEYRLIQQKRREIEQYIREKQLGNDDDERQTLEQEKRSLRGTLQSIEKRHVLEFMTNAGILPNYAFPETGVTLNARVAGARSEDSEIVPPAKDIELVRPARQAIKELVPGGSFYTQGYKLQISGLNVVSWKEEAENFRFCSQCDHLMKEVTGPPVSCPKCGHDSWSSAANQHRFLKLQAVKSFNTEAAAKLDDSSEERERNKAYRSRHFRLDSSTIYGAYALKNIPFGIEFIRKVEVFDINAGIAGDFLDRNRIATITGLEVPVHGFITCKYCGLSSSSTHKKDKDGINAKQARDYHYPYCKHRERSYEGLVDEVFEEVYLYRSIQTEALKILLPVQEFDSEDTVSLFRAGLEKGIRHYYKGNPQHLDIQHYAEHNPKTQKMDRYLILYDIVPGGTGYLEKLFDQAAFSEVLQLAHAAIRDCSCQHRGKDGCYHCIYSYGNQYERGQLSRQKAEAFFQKIVGAIDSWESFPNGLSNITSSGFIEESELEERFIRTLRVYAHVPAQQELGCRFEPFNQDGEIWYRMRLVDQENTLEYHIQPQFRLGPSQGVKYHTVADFMLHCVYANIRGQEIPLDELAGFLPIAVYLDGHQYHASSGNLRFENDLKKRSAIAESGQYLVWTMTWDDLNQLEEGMSDTLTKTAVANVRSREMLQKFPKYQQLKADWLSSKNNFSRLLWLLQHGTQREYNNYRQHFRYLIAAQQSNISANILAKAEAKRFVQQGESFPATKPGKAGEEYFEISLSSGTVIHYRMMERFKDLDALIHLKVDPVSDGYPKTEWEHFWRIHNLLQTEESGWSIDFGQEAEPSAYVPDSADASDILVYYDAEYHPLIQQLLDRDIPFSRDGSFILEEAGVVVAEAVLGFEVSKIVWGPISEADAAAFQSRGYSLGTIATFDLNKIKTHETSPVR